MFILDDIKSEKKVLLFRFVYFWLLLFIFRLLVVNNELYTVGDMNRQVFKSGNVVGVLHK